MKRLLAAAATAALVFPATGAGQASDLRTETLKGTATGAQIKAGRDSRLILHLASVVTGEGAASLTVKPTTGGKLAKGTIYDARGTLNVRFVFKRTSLAPDGRATFTGKGEVISGAGDYEAALGKFTVTGRRSAARVYTLTFDGEFEHVFVPRALGSGRAR